MASAKAGSGPVQPKLYLYPAHNSKGSPAPFDGSQLFEKLDAAFSALALAENRDTGTQATSVDFQGVTLRAGFTIKIFLRHFVIEQLVGAAAFIFPEPENDESTLVHEVHGFDLATLKTTPPHHLKLSAWWVLLAPISVVEETAKLLVRAGALCPRHVASSWAPGSQIGEGSFSTLFKMKRRLPSDDPADDFLLAKVPLLDTSTTSIQVLPQQLCREVEMLVRVQGHPNVTAFRGVLNVAVERDEERNVLGIGTRFCAMGPLATLLSDRALREGEARKIFQGLLYGLEHIHLRKVVHRDIKPDNISMMSMNQAIISDFSHACCLDDKDSLLEVVETPGYTAPEVLLGVYGEKIDLFALGCCLFHAVKGRNPFGADEADRRERSKTGSDALTAADMQGLSRGLQDFMKSLLKVDTSQRPAAQGALRHRWANGLTFELPTVSRVGTEEGGFSQPVGGFSQPVERRRRDPTPPPRGLLLELDNSPPTSPLSPSALSRATTPCSLPPIDGPGKALTVLSKSFLRQVSGPAEVKLGAGKRFVRQATPFQITEGDEGLRQTAPACEGLEGSCTLSELRHTAPGEESGAASPVVKRKGMILHLIQNPNAEPDVKRRARLGPLLISSETAISSEENGEASPRLQEVAERINRRAQKDQEVKLTSMKEKLGPLAPRTPKASTDSPRKQRSLRFAVEQPLSEVLSGG